MSESVSGQAQGGLKPAAGQGQAFHDPRTFVSYDFDEHSADLGDAHI